MADLGTRCRANKPVEVNGAKRHWVASGTQPYNEAVKHSATSGNF